MEMIKCSIRATSLLAITIVMLIMVSTMTPSASGQVTTACTSSLISSFTPCLNYLTGSVNGGGSPTADCCTALGSLIGSSTQCACLILTASVPLNVPINRTLSISLPRACKSTSVPLKCNGTATALPSPGPVSYAPSLPPIPPSTVPDNPVSSDVPPSSPQSLSPSLSPPELQSPPVAADGPTANQGQRPLLLPSSALKLSNVYLSILMPLGVLGTSLLNKF